MKENVIFVIIDCQELFQRWDEPITLLPHFVANAIGVLPIRNVNRWVRSESQVKVFGIGNAEMIGLDVNDGAL